MRDWTKGECEPIPGKTMPHFSIVERDYVNLAHRFNSLGPGIKEHGVEDHGVEMEVADLYDEFAKLVPPYEWGGRQYPSLVDAAHAADAVLFFAPESNGEVAYRGFKGSRAPRRTAAGRSGVLGSATLIAFLIQVVAGIALASGYVASSGQAYSTLQFISGTHFGRIVRGIHAFGASAMIILIGLHTIRVYLMASYKYPRQVNWLTGVGLLVLTLLMAFTGQLLRRDQTGFWSVLIAAEQAG